MVRGRRRRRRSEERALRRLLERSPDHLRAVERLAELLFLAGRAEESTRLRARKAELDRAKAEYEMLLFRPDAASRPAPIARLAEALGRRLEARILWALASRTRSARPRGGRGPLPTRGGVRRAPPATGFETLGALLADLEKARPDRLREPMVYRGATPAFRDDAEAAGLRFVFENGAEPSRQLPETMSGGVGLLDYDGDGWLDVYCVQGGPFPPPGPASPNGDRLFRNRGDGTFEDASRRLGHRRMSPADTATASPWAMWITTEIPMSSSPDGGPMPSIATGGTARSRTSRRSAGLGGDRDWPTSAAFADLDGDGDLDLYVCHYIEWDAEHPTICRDSRKADAGLLRSAEIPVAAGPRLPQ